MREGRGRRIRTGAIMTAIAMNHFTNRFPVPE